MKRTLTILAMLSLVTVTWTAAPAAAHEGDGDICHSRGDLEEFCNETSDIADLVPSIQPCPTGFGVVVNGGEVCYTVEPCSSGVGIVVNDAELCFGD